MLDDFIPIFNKHSMKLRDKLEKCDGDIQRKVLLCTLDIIIETAMGVKSNAQDDNNSFYFNSLERFNDLLVKKLLNPMMRFDFIFKHSSLGREYFKTTDQVKRVSEELVRKRKKEYLAARHLTTDDMRKPAFLDLLLQHHLRDSKCRSSDF